MTYAYIAYGLLLLTALLGVVAGLFAILRYSTRAELGVLVGSSGLLSFLCGSYVERLLTPVHPPAAVWGVVVFQAVLAYYLTKERK